MCHITACPPWTCPALLGGLSTTLDVSCIAGWPQHHPGRVLHCWVASALRLPTLDVSCIAGWPQHCDCPPWTCPALLGGLSTATAHPGRVLHCWVASALRLPTLDVSCIAGWPQHCDCPPWTCPEHSKRLSVLVLISRAGWMDHMKGMCRTLLPVCMTIFAPSPVSTHGVCILCISTFNHVSCSPPELPGQFL